MHNKSGLLLSPERNNDSKHNQLSKIILLQFDIKFFSVAVKGMLDL